MRGASMLSSLASPVTTTLLSLVLHSCWTLSSVSGEQGLAVQHAGIPAENASHEKRQKQDAYRVQLSQGSAFVALPRDKKLSPPAHENDNVVTAASSSKSDLELTADALVGESLGNVEKAVLKALGEKEHSEKAYTSKHSEEPEKKGEEDKVKKPPIAVGVALSLIIGVSFIMCIQYLVNSHDNDIRMHTWEVICATVSIFVAVLLFQGGNAVLLTFFKGSSKGVLLYVAMGECFFWCFVLHWVLAMCPGKKGWAVLLAHMTGFSAIGGWGAVQQFDFFQGERLACNACRTDIALWRLCHDPSV